MSDLGSGDSGSSPGRRHCAVFFGKTLNSHSAYFLFEGVTPIYELVPNPGEGESSNTLVALCHLNRSETGLILL